MIQYFTGRDKFTLEEEMKTNLYIQDLNERGKLEIFEDKFILKDFCGYIGETLYIPQKLHSMLNLNETLYKHLFTNLFDYILQYFDNDILFQLFPTRFGLGEYSLNESQIFQLNIILKNKEFIEYALYIIAKQPYKSLEEEKFYADFNEISSIDDNIVESILYNPQNWYHNDPLKPTKVLQYRNIESLNNRENSFLKYFIKELILILEKLLLFTKDTPIQRMQIRSLRDDIDEVLTLLPFDTIDDMILFPYNSQVLIKRDGYRELFDIYNRLYLSFKPSLFNSLENAISLKDISTIWEYYVLVKIIEQFGEIESEDMQKNLNIEKNRYETIKVKFKNGVKLYYQTIFESYSKIKFRPDFYIEIDKKVIILDAKFRLFDSNRTEILRNLHYYKDGLKVDSVIAVTIGDKEQGIFYDINNTEKEVQSFQEIFIGNGIGYISLNLINLIKDYNNDN